MVLVTVSAPIYAIRMRTIMIRRMALCPLAFLAVSAILLTGCGSNKQSEADANSGTPAQQQQAIEQQAAARAEYAKSHPNGPGSN